MSDEIPEYAVIKHPDGYDRVNYNVLDVDFKLINWSLMSGGWNVCKYINSHYESKTVVLKILPVTK